MNRVAHGEHGLEKAHTKAKAMPLIFGLFFGLAVWLMSEFLAFSLVAQAIGVDGAVLVTLATSLAGFLLLRRLGWAARKNLSAILSQGGGRVFWLAPERLRAGFLAALGAGLLILPGFVSDGIGLLLLARAAQTGPLFGAESQQKADDMIELSPQDWQRIDESDRH